MVKSLFVCIPNFILGDAHNPPDRGVRITEPNNLVRAQVTDDPHTNVRALGRNIAMPKSKVLEIIFKKNLNSILTKGERRTRW